MAKKSKSLLALDGRHLLWRSFDAFGDLVVDTPKGYIATGAIYGFLSTALRVHHRYGGQTVVAWEGRNNYRYQLYADYKRKEEPSDEEVERIKDMAEQERRLMAVLRALGVCQYYGVGGEADDVLGWLAEHHQGKVVLYSGDSDLCQLVKNGKVSLVSPQHRGPDRIYQTEQDVEDKFEVPPDRIAELKALAGDPSDKIPGLRGIGPKTAAKAIVGLGGVPEIVRAAKSGAEIGIPERHRATIVDGAQQLELYLKLTRIRRDLTPAVLEPKIDKKLVVRTFMAYRFRSLIAPAELTGLMRLGCESS